MNRTAIVSIAVALVVAACSSSSEDAAPASTTSTVEDTAAASTTVAESPESTTTTAAPTTTMQGTTTVAASASIGECVIGTWELDSQAFFDQIVASLPEDEQVGTFTFKGGQYLLVVEGDGTFASIRDDWSFGAETDDGEIELRINDEQTGTYEFDGTVLSTTLAGGSPAEVELLVDGVPFELPGGRTPVEPPAAEFEGAVVSCDGDVMSSSVPGEEFAAMWRRVG